MSNSTELIIRQAEILFPDGHIETGDVAISQGKIEEVASRVQENGREEINGEGLTLLPGVIDPQVHFREPGLEHKEDLHTASCACAKGGVTSFLEMPNTRPPTINQTAMDEKLGLAAEKCLVNYGFFVGATGDNLADLETVNPACGIKIFMGSAHGALLVSEEEQLEPIFAQGKRLIAVHAEDQARIVERKKQFHGATNPAVHSQIQDNQAALNATKLALKLSKRYQRRLHILHLSTAEEAQLLREDKPSWVTAEVTPQHLLLNTSAYEKIGTLAQMNPPLRSRSDNEELWQALLDGVLDFVATDHAPHTLEEKGKGYPHSPSGMPGVETSLALMLTQAKAGFCTVAQVSHWLSTAVAKAYNIPNKGAIAPGYDADLVLVDLNSYYPVRREDIVSKCGWSPFEGWNLTGWAQTTIVGGQIAYHQRKLFPQVRGKPLQFNG
jgi:dihydroorotase